MFKRLLVANRGEIALRIIRAAQALGIETVAVYSEADAASPHLRHADHTVCLGPGMASASYLDMDAVLQAARQLECQALHPGYGFLSENADFAARCAQQKTTFVGPSPRLLSLMGDKVTARSTMAAVGVGGVPGTNELVATPEAAREAAESIGYPVLLKATAGGGGKGMRIVADPSDLADAFASAQMEAGAAFGNEGLYLERYVEGGRHIEFQILGDQYGHVVHLGERECSIQRSNQKLVEEAPSPAISDEQRRQVGETLTRALSELGYVGAGTVEFLRAPTGELFFMEMNTRLQVEHPVTEMVTGVDLVQWQIRLACGEPLTLSQDDIEMSGHAIECRINAEDPAQNFAPSPGTITTFDCPASWRAMDVGDVRLDSHVESGYRIPPFYDSMIGKLIVRGADRSATIARMAEALDELTIEGVATTVGIHRAIMDDPTFQSGDYDTRRMTAAMKEMVRVDQES